jgi:hypothetical protein
VESANYEAPQELASFSDLLSVPPSYIKIFSSAYCSDPSIILWITTPLSFCSDPSIILWITTPLSFWGFRNYE